MTAPSQQKLKVQGAAVVTANRLADGAVVYLTADKTWSNDLQSAQIVTSQTAAKALLAEVGADDAAAVGAYVAPVELTGGVVVPGNLREQIRTTGPTFELPVTFGI